MSKRLNKIELKEAIQRVYEQLKTAVFGSKERRNLTNSLGRLKRKLEERYDEVIVIDKRAKLSPIEKEIYLNKTFNSTPVDISNYKHKELLDDDYYYCSRCGKKILERDKFYIDVFDLGKGFICSDCNKEFYNSKAVQILC